MHIKSMGNPIITKCHSLILIAIQTEKGEIMAAGKIIIVNRSPDTLSVAINIWSSNGGNPGTFAVLPGATGDSATWSRTDERGYVMFLKQGGSEAPFYVVPGSTITFVSMDSVVDNGQRIHPITAPLPSLTEERAEVNPAEK